MDYVIVAPAGLGEAAERLAEYRRGRGLRALTVDLREMYDTFGYRLASPDAIRDFMSFARSNWRIPPRYLLLAGDGTYDFNNYEGYGDCLLPPFLIGTPDGIFASDRPFGDTSGDSVPEIAVGRIPAATAGDLDEIRQKIGAYEAAPPGPWTSTVLLLADNPDFSGDFTGDSEAIAAMLPDGYSSVNMYLADVGITTTRILLFDSLDEGAVLLNYMGHGGLFQLADENILTAADIGTSITRPCCPCSRPSPARPGCSRCPVSASSARPPVPAWRRRGGGLVPHRAVAGPQARILDEALVRALFVAGRRPLGTALLQAQQEFINRGGWLYILEVYNLLGDPALEIK